MIPSKRVYVISDLHIGGKYNNEDDPLEKITEINSSERGFRICTQVNKLADFIKKIGEEGTQQNIKTELVINGDFIDFLAEEWQGEDKWLPFIDDGSEAAKRLEVIIKRDKILFDELKHFLAKGHKLTLLLGNHDVELSLPAVREVLLEKLEAKGKHLTFIYDGEAYQVGRVLIEHGNRYDGFNVLDYDGLRQIRSLQSRREFTENFVFTPPPGSFIVARVMNNIKEKYPFIDLLKPETTAAIPILLALAPEYRKHIFYIASLVHQAHQHGPDEEGVMRYKSEISTTIDDGRNILVNQFSQSGIPKNEVNDFFKSIESSDEQPAGVRTQSGAEIASVTLSDVWSHLKLLTANKSKPVSTRLSALLTALQANQSDISFDPNKEEEKYDLPASRLLGTGSFDVVIFGHTHLPKKIKKGKGIYINTGTWADVIKFPENIIIELQTDKEKALEALKVFVEDIEKKNFGSYIEHSSSYALIELDQNENIIRAGLIELDKNGKILKEDLDDF